MVQNERLIGMDEAPPPFDIYASLLSLPGLLGTTLANVPADVPYLYADPTVVDQWRNKLRGHAGFKVGIVWQGRAKHLRIVGVPYRLQPLRPWQALKMSSC